MLLIVRMQHAVALNYSANRHTEHVQQIVVNIEYIYIGGYRALWGEREQAMHYSIDCYVAKALAAKYQITAHRHVAKTSL